MKTLNIKRTLLSLTLGAMMTLGCAFMMGTGSISAYAVEPLPEAGQKAIDNGNGDLLGAKEYSGELNAADAAYSYVAQNGKSYYVTQKGWEDFQKSGKYEAGTGGGSGRTADGNKINNDMKDIEEGLNITADTGKASEALGGLVPWISTALGIIVVLISVGMTIFSAFDICYIAFPVFRNNCENAKQTGQGVMASSKTNPQTGEAKLRFVSDDAQYAVAASETVQTGKNPFVIYFKKRILSYILLAILVFILLTGNVTVLTRLAVNLVSGILSLIANMGT